MSKRRRNEKKSIGESFMEAREFVSSIIPDIKELLDSHDIAYDESDNGTELSIDTTDKTYGEQIEGLIKREIKIPEKHISCLIDVKFSSVSNRVFIRLKRK